MWLSIAFLFTVFSIIWANVTTIDDISQEPLRHDSPSFGWWEKPPITPMIKIYIYNVTNGDEFLKNGDTPIVHELGPYVYMEKWEKNNITFNDNGTVSFIQKKIFMFSESLSNGTEDDMVVVPNIPMLSATSLSKHAPGFLRQALGQIIDILKIKPFVEVSVGKLLWGYEDLLLKLAKEVTLKEQKVPYEKFGLMYNKNGTIDTITLFTGANEFTKYGLIDKFNGESHLTHYTSDNCNSLLGYDGSIFPPDLTENSTIHIYNKDLCRLIPLVYEGMIESSENISTYRFTPSLEVDEESENSCFCPDGPPCAPPGFFNVSLCQFDSPVLLSFPHFYLANDSYGTVVEGISPPEPETHGYYIDIEPTTGKVVGAKARIQYNLDVTHVPDIKQIESFPDIVFPIMWYEEGFDALSSK